MYLLDNLDFLQIFDLTSNLLYTRLYCRPWNYTKSISQYARVAGFTAGQELHLALKIQNINY